MSEDEEKQCIEISSEDRLRIEYESSCYAQGFSMNGFRLRMDGYAAGATAENNKLNDQLAKERQIIEALKKQKFELETSYNFMSQDMDAKRSLCHEQHKQLEKERELRKELVKGLQNIIAQARKSMPTHGVLTAIEALIKKGT